TLVFRTLKKASPTFACSRYLGEIINERLITNNSKKSYIANPFAPYANRVGYAPYANYAGYAMYAGHSDFPFPNEF
ncbi:MAG: hypothetical protein ACOYBN_16800, partial [Limnohabitans sp.]